MCLKVTSFNSQTCLVPGKQTINQTGNVRMNVTLRRVVQPLLQWKAIGITYSECVLVALVIQHATRMCHIVICGLSGSTTFFPHNFFFRKSCHLLSGTIFGKKNNKKRVF